MNKYGNFVKARGAVTPRNTSLNRKQKQMPLYQSTQLTTVNELLSAPRYSVILQNEKPKRMSLGKQPDGIADIYIETAEDETFTKRDRKEHIFISFAGEDNLEKKQKNSEKK